jgi:hypothetical protein
MDRDIVSGFGDLLRNVTFVRLFVGRVATDAGDSFYYIGSMWLVWELTGSPFYTGVAGAAVQIPNALRFLAGPLVDRWRLRRILLGTQLANAVGVSLIPIAAAMEWLSVWLVLVLVPISNFINNFVYPAQDAALPRIVGDDLLTRANSLFSTTRKTVDLLANAVAGALIVAVGAVGLFVVDAVTFLVAALLFAGVSVRPVIDDADDAEDAGNDGERGNSDGCRDDGTGVTADTDAAANGVPEDDYLAELRAGFNYVRGSALLAVVLAAMVSNVATMAANAVLPAFADSLAGPAAYGLLVAAIGAGSLLGTAGAFLVEEYSLS